MKKLFTLLVGALMAGNAFGQTNWKNIVVNGDMEGEAPAYEKYGDMPAEAWNSFWVHEWPKGEVGETQYQGTATIVEGLGVDGSKCIKVVARSEAQADEAQNKVSPDGQTSLASWDCQFFIYATEPMPEGKEVRLTMYVKGDKAGSIETQAHWGPGDYNHYQLFGNVSVTTEWQKVTLEATVGSDHVKASDGKAFQSVAFNLSTDKEGNVYYFDNIKLQIRDPKEDDGSDAGAWINFMRRGIWSSDYIGETEYGTMKDEEGNTLKDENGKDVPAYVATTNFMIQTSEGLVKAPVVEVPGEAGVMAVHVPVRGYYTKDVLKYLEDGSPDFDDDGNQKTQTIYYWNNGDSIGTSAPARWTCQFFVSTLHKMVKGEKYRFKFQAKADKASALGTQAHSMPTHFVGWESFGGESAFPIATDWTTFELGDFESVTDASKKVIPSSAAGCQTITFDCVPLEGDDNNFYFIFDECSFTEKYVTIEDRTLGTPEKLLLPINTDDNDKAKTIDATPMLTTFELEAFSFLTNPKAGDGIKLYTVIPPDDPEDDPTPSFGAILGWNDGGFVDGNGLTIDDDMGINIRFDEESVNGNNVDIVVWNNPDSGISFADGKTVETKLAVSNAGWYYVYEITLGTEETLAGIKTVKTAKAGNGLIYNLAGQRVDDSYKGLVIKNGQKMIQK